MAQTNKTPSDQPNAGQVCLLAEFPTSESLIAAAAGVRKAGYRRFDCHSPFPIHGIDAAMGNGRTPLPWFVLLAGLTGAAAAVLLQWWTNAVDYPLVISGKPLFSLPANVPIIFELIVLFAALTAFGGAIVLNNLPRYGHPLLGSKRFRRVTSDGFFLSINAADPKYREASAAELLRSLGATAVETCAEPTDSRALPKWLTWTLMVASVAALLPPLLVASARLAKSPSPRVHIVPDMDFQPKFKFQTANALFDDGRSMRPPVPGTIAESDHALDEHRDRGKKNGQWAATFPMPVGESMIRRGQQQFNIFCAPCHGLAGMGDGIVSQRALQRSDSRWTPPTSLHVDAVRQQPVGQVFGTISSGIRTMPSYAAQISVEDRWAMVLYVRALQRSQKAELGDVPEADRNQLK